MNNENNAVEKKTKSSVQSFPLVEEILSRLPAKSLLRFRCVSQSWRSLIGNKRFIKKHLQNITKNQSYTYRRALFHCPFKHGLKQRSMQSYSDEPSVDPSSFDDPKNHHLTMKRVHVVDHCNGVLCIHKKPDSFFLWNPTTRISIKLPKIEHKTGKYIYEHKTSKYSKYGFGWDEESDAYKVFVGLSDLGQKKGKVYSTKTNSWKVVEHGFVSLYRNRKAGKFASGKIHWLSEGGHGIETFDLNNEVFGMVENPCKPEVGINTRLYNYYGCFAVLSESKDYKTRRLWAMNEYGAKDSWVEVDVQPGQIPTSCCYVIYFYIESLVSL